MIFFKFVDPENHVESKSKRIDIEELKKYLLKKKIKCFLSLSYG